MAARLSPRRLLVAPVVLRLKLLDQLLHLDRVALGVAVADDRDPGRLIVSIETSENITCVSILIDATCAMWIDSSSLPIHCGLYERHARRRDDDLRREEAIAAAQRLARNTCSPGTRRPLPDDHADERPATTTPTTTTRTTIDVAMRSIEAVHGRDGKLAARRITIVSGVARAASRSRVARARPSSVPHGPSHHVLPADRRSRRFAR